MRLQLLCLAVPDVEHQVAVTAGAVRVLGQDHVVRPLVVEMGSGDGGGGIWDRLDLRPGRLCRLESVEVCSEQK